MRISTDIELEAAKEVFRKYNFVPGSNQQHPLSASLELLAAAVQAYEYQDR